MTYTFDEQIVSDLHKDARGFRPTQYWWDQWSLCTGDQKQTMWDGLHRELEETMAAERAAEARAALALTERLEQMYELGAKSEVQGQERSRGRIAGSISKAGAADKIKASPINAFSHLILNRIFLLYISQTAIPPSAGSLRMVGVAGFEPTTSRTPCVRATNCAIPRLIFV